jgi:NADH-quinone oxidoreductase subunit N
MNLSALTLELAVAGVGLQILLVDLWTPTLRKRHLGYLAAIAVIGIFIASFCVSGSPVRYAFGSGTTGALVIDPLALFFKRFFLVAAALVLVMAVEFSDRIEAGISEFYALILFAVSGMMLVASANDFVLVFVSLELITITFYVLTSFQRARVGSLEAGIKYLIISALSTGFLALGIAFVFGTANTTNFSEIRAASATLTQNRLFLLGLLLVFVALGFKIAAFPFQIWAPDVYQGSPVPTTALLAIGSKAAGVALWIRILYGVVPDVASRWNGVFIVLAALTILYGNLCAIPQRNLKRLLGYSSISNAGYVLLGIVALNDAGVSAILYFLGGYLFTLVAAFTVICLVMSDSEDVSALSGLNQRSPGLAAAMTLAMVSLAGVPPLAGFFGKFLLLKALIERGSADPACYVLALIAVIGVAISLYYYFGVIRAMYWPSVGPNLGRIPLSWPTRAVLGLSIAGMLYLGLFPARMLNASDFAAHTVHVEAPAKLALH